MWRAAGMARKCARSGPSSARSKLPARAPTPVMRSGGFQPWAVPANRRSGVPSADARSKGATPVPWRAAEGTPFLCNTGRGFGFASLRDGRKRQPFPRASAPGGIPFIDCRHRPTRGHLRKGEVAKCGEVFASTRTVRSRPSNSTTLRPRCRRRLPPATSAGPPGPFGADRVRDHHEHASPPGCVTTTCPPDRAADPSKEHEPLHHYRGLDRGVT